MTRDTILYVGGFEMPDKNAAAQRVIANGKIFRELGYKVAYLGVDKSCPQGTRLAQTKAEHFGFECWAAPYSASKAQWLRSITTADDVKALTEGPLAGRIHSIICYNHPAIAQLRIKAICRKISANFICDVTEWYENAGGGLLFRTVKGLDTAARMNFVSPRADRLIVTSPYIEKFYRGRVENIVTLPTLYDADVVDLPALKSPASSATQTVRMMYAGSAFTLDRLAADRSNVKDRLDVVIKILAGVFPAQKNFELDVFGLEKDNFLAAFPDLKDSLNQLGARVKFHGRVPHKRILNAIIDSDYTVFVRHLSRVIEAGFPSKFSESITFGTPVICNIYSSTQDYAKDGENCHALPLHDLPAQVAKMAEILSLAPAQHQAMKQYCRAHKVFDYRAFKAPVAEFFSALNAPKK